MGRYDDLQVHRREINVPARRGFRLAARFALAVRERLSRMG
jgi:hypothetical protein